MKILTVCILLVLLVYFGFSAINADKVIQRPVPALKVEQTQTYEIEIEEVDE